MNMKSHAFLIFQIIFLITLIVVTFYILTNDTKNKQKYCQEKYGQHWNAESMGRGRLVCANDQTGELRL